MKLANVLSSLSLVTALSYSSLSQAVLIDFESLQRDNNRQNAIDYRYEEDGFILTSLTEPSGTPHRFFSFGLNSDHFAGSTGLYNDTPNGIIELRLVDGGTFDFLSIDLADLTLPASAEVMFVGEFADGSTIDRRYFTRADSDFRTYNFTGFDDIVSLSWTQLAPFHQFDNITVGDINVSAQNVKVAALESTPIPNPASLSLVALGLLLLGLQCSKKHFKTKT